MKSAQRLGMQLTALDTESKGITRRQTRASCPRPRSSATPGSATAQKASLKLSALFERNGYIRRPNPDRLLTDGPQRYKKGSEVRLVAKSKVELARVRRLLKLLGFTAGRPFAKGHQYCMPIYGHEQVAKFVALVSEYPA